MLVGSLVGRNLPLRHFGLYDRYNITVVMAMLLILAFKFLYAAVWIRCSETIDSSLTRRLLCACIQGSKWEFRSAGILFKRTQGYTIRKMENVNGYSRGSQTVGTTPLGGRCCSSGRGGVFIRGTYLF
jgi:hypothetical protein